MELVKAIEERRSIRKYEEKDISDDILLELIRCATLAPSSIFRIKDNSTSNNFS